jgi:hypothetical protein
MCPDTRYRELLRLLGVLPHRGSCTHDLGQHYPALVATTDSCARPPPSHVLCTMAWYGSLCRLPCVPCWAEALPDVISSICVEVLGPVPRRASAVPMPVSSRRTSASPYMQEVRRAETPAMMATSMTNQFRGCRRPWKPRASPCSQPSLSTSRRTWSRWPRTRRPRCSNASTPSSRTRTFSACSTTWGKRKHRSRC